MNHNQTMDGFLTGHDSVIASGFANNPSWNGGLRDFELFDPQIIGRSPAMREPYRLIERVGPTDKTVLIQGEIGTGKELIARAFHRRSHRASNPFVTLNCTSLCEPLLENELLGHNDRTLSDRSSTRSGLLERADGGTLFINEIGDIPIAVQGEFLLLLDDTLRERAEANGKRAFDIRLLASTSRDLAGLVEEGRFRDDLYYRINVVKVDLPPLRDRGRDLELLLQHYLGGGWEVDCDAERSLLGYDWPGNVRQLINVIERAKLLADDTTIRVNDLPREITREQTESKQRNAGELAHVERAKIVEVLLREKGNKTIAARTLGIDRRKLYRLLDRFKIDPREFARSPAEI